MFINNNNNNINKNNIIMNDVINMKNIDDVLANNKHNDNLNNGNNYIHTKYIT